MREWIVPDEVSTSNDEKWLEKLKKKKTLDTKVARIVNFKLSR